MIIGGERVQMSEEPQAQSKRQPLRCEHRQIAAHSREHRSALMTQEDEHDSPDQEPRPSTRKNDINHPLQYEWREKR